MESSWCSLPFTSVTYYADGAVAPCCKHIGRDSSQNFYTLPPKDALNSPLFLELQNQFIRGERPQACIKCWNAESQGVPSYRLMTQEMWDWAKIPSTGVKKLQMIDVAFGNLCNAACLTCDTVSSHQWQEETQELLQVEGNPFERFVYETQSHSPHWSSDHLRDLKVVLFDQSEPFLQPGFKKLIGSLKEAGSLQRIALSLSTNGSYWPQEKLLDDLCVAEKIELQISVDAVGDMFEYLRYPLKWEIVDGITDRWLEWASKRTNVHVIARQTLSAVNLLHEPHVRKWWASKTNTKLTYGVVHNPWYLSPMVLPAVQRSQWLTEASHHPRVPKTLSLSEDWHPSYKKLPEEGRLALLRDFLKGREKRRGLSLQEICPETYKTIF